MKNEYRYVEERLENLSYGLNNEIFEHVEEMLQSRTRVGFKGFQLAKAQGWVQSHNADLQYRVAHCRKS